VRRGLAPGRAEAGVWLIRVAVGAASGTNHRATDIARAALAANNVTDADSKGVQTLAQAIQGSLRNHAGETVQQVGEGVPARWILAAN
jgi:hypothetical protein